MAIDLTSDVGFAHLNQILHIIPHVPEFVKSANWPTVKEVQELPNTAFADSIERRFPVHTKSAAYLSYAYFLKQKDLLEKRSADRIQQAFYSAGDFWGILSDMQATAEAMEKKAETHKEPVDADFALVVSHQGKSHRWFPVDTVQSLLKSSEELIQSRAKLTYPMRQQAAYGILKAAHQIGLPVKMLPDVLQRMAGFGASLKEAASKEIRRRIDCTKTASQKLIAEPLEKLASTVNQAEAIIPGATLVKIAKALDIFDRFMKLTDEYGKSFDYPEDALFKLSQESINQVQNEIVQLTNGSAYWLSDLTKAADAFNSLGGVETALSDPLGKLDLRKVAEVIPTLPRDSANTLDLALAAAGVPKANLNKEAIAQHILGVSITPVRETPSVVLPVRDEREKRAEEVKTQRAKEVFDRIRTVSRSPISRDKDGTYKEQAPNKTTVSKT